MRWIAGIRSDILYTVQKRPLDPRWSNKDLQVMLGWCASAQAMGWTEERAFQTAEAIVMQSRNKGIHWTHVALSDDIECLLAISRKEHEAE